MCTCVSYIFCNFGLWPREPFALHKQCLSFVSCMFLALFASNVFPALFVSYNMCIYVYIHTYIRPCLRLMSFRPYFAINVFPALFVFHGFLSPCPSSAVSSSRMRFQGFRVRTARAWALLRCTSCCAPCSDCSIRPRAAASSRARALSSALAHLYIP